VNLNDLHRRLLQDVLAIGNTFPFVITGGYAVQDTPYGPVLALDDVIGTKVRALANRGYPRDLIDVHAAASIRPLAELESLGRLHARDEFSL
jgi:hypothetical protein